MPRKDIDFRTSDRVTLRGWLYTSAGDSTKKLPCFIMSHGWSAVKEIDLDAFAEYFRTHLALTTLVYDQRGFGTSDVKAGSPRLEINPREQQSDVSDAVTFAQTMPEVDAARVGAWGTSVSAVAGNVLYTGAVDRRIKVVRCQRHSMRPMVDGWDNFNRLIRFDFQGGMEQAFAGDESHGSPVRASTLTQS
ncbi:Alpha/Beta hydrolase protein [Neohortaea acidophila]|uniref:Alpha/Beta hydrolase protein n=1 Tax=Neohortaea acidophila TaxID=245834 RepID=A0A6A6PQC0_9PEZI|nr:Alpha/Beta hydrolase protein [Neohortaea acidophila]KAF2482135.1 Alpha/Beta hydrolase protein [Neohortaea acidophila]